MRCRRHGFFTTYVQGTTMHFTMGCLGPDALKAGVGRAEFQALTMRAITALRRVGGSPASISQKFKNWVVTSRVDEGQRRAFLIDVGNVCLRGAPNRREHS